MLLYFQKVESMAVQRHSIFFIFLFFHSYISRMISKMLRALKPNQSPSALPKSTIRLNSSQASTSVTFSNEKNYVYCCFYCTIILVTKLLYVKICKSIIQSIRLSDQGDFPGRFFQDRQLKFLVGILCSDQYPLYNLLVLSDMI